MSWLDIREVGPVGDLRMEDVVWVIYEKSKL